MKVIAHLSDLHFGRSDMMVVDALLADIRRHKPTLVVISGDLTQRARNEEFAQARTFLGRLCAPVVIVPGNHDLSPLYMPLARVLFPRARFRRNLPGHDPLPVWQDDGVIAVGLDSTRSLRWKSGALKSAHLDHLERTLAAAPVDRTRLVFLHHPPGTASGGHPYETLLDHRIDLVLTGHVHRAKVELVTGDHGRALILVQATTACSTRLRDDSNGYCLVRLSGDHLEVGIQGWSGEIFHNVRRHWFERRAGLWQESARPDPVFAH